MGSIDLDAARTVWESARCAEVDPELFFPDQGESSPEALALCASCLVRQPCRAVFDPLVPHGILAGRTARERAQDRARLRAGTAA